MTIRESVGAKLERRRPLRWARDAWRQAPRLAGLLLLLAFLVLVVSILLTRVPVFGYRAVILAGGSMEPAVDNGSLIMSRRAEAESLGVGDVITFRYSESKTTITHRIAAVREESGRLWFRMKGDANRTPDPQEVSFEVGRPYRMMFAVPYGGYVLAFMGSGQMVLLLVVLPLLGLVVLHLLGDDKGKRPARTE